MNNKVKLTLASCALATITMTGAVPVIGAVVHADTTKAAATQTLTPLTDEEAAQFDRYIVVKNNQYVIQIPKGVKVDPDLLKRATQQVQKTNEQLKTTPVIIDPSTKSAMYTLPVSQEPQDPSGSNTEDIDLERGRKKGVTKISFHWNYARVWLSRNATRAAAIGGIAVAGYYISGGLVAGAAGALGYYAGLIPGGIRFDYNYYARVRNVRWQ